MNSTFLFALGVAAATFLSSIEPPAWSKRNLFLNILYGSIAYAALFGGVITIYPAFLDLKNSSFLGYFTIMTCIVFIQTLESFSRRRRTRDTSN